MSELNLPGAIGRWWRNRVLLAATVLLAAFGPAAAGVTAGAQVTVTETVDENWRGIYDILVRPAGARSDLEVENNLVEPNFLSFSRRDGMTISDLEAIRRIDGVEVAAPASYVGYVGMDSFHPQIFIDRPSLPNDSALYAANVEVLTSDGVTSSVLLRSSGHVLLPPREFLGHGPFTGWHSFRHSSGIHDPWAAYLISEGVGVRIASPVLAVDPGAEQELLGPSLSFLMTLERVGDGSRRTAGRFPVELIPGDFWMAVRQLQSFAHVGASTTPALPLLVSRTLYAPLVGELSVSRVGELLTDQELDDVVSLDDVLLSRLGQESVVVGSSRVDAADRLRPFVVLSMELPWPGSTGPTVEMGTSIEAHLAQDFWRGLPGALAYESMASRPGSSAVSLGVEGQDVGFRNSEMVNVHPVEDPVRDVLAYPFVLVPIGEFDLGLVDLPSDPVSWAPVGAYEPPASWLVADGEGVPLVEPVEMFPTFDPSGLLLPPPLAITDLAGGTVLRGENLIDAVRVRVAGLGGFDDVSRSRVEAVAGAIIDLGFDVDIMAGSSPQPVELFVPGYYVVVDDSPDIGEVILFGPMGSRSVVLPEYPSDGSVSALNSR